MCDTVRLPGGEAIHSLADLRRRYDVQPADTEVEGDPEPPCEECCLCQVDVDAVLERAGAHYVRDLGRDLGDYVVVATAEEADRLAAEWHRPVTGTMPVDQVAEALGVADAVPPPP